MRIFPVLSWMLIPGCWALTGPGTVRGPAGGSVAVRCSYDGGYESYSKYWYQESSGYIAQSNGTEAEVKRGRVSLQDNHRLRSFTVTVENLTPADAGTYLCGIEKVGFDPVHNVEVIVTPGIPVSGVQLQARHLHGRTCEPGHRQLSASPCRQSPQNERGQAALVTSR